MVTEEIINLILNNGVAVGMLLYFVLRFEKILNQNTEAMRLMLKKIEKIC